MSGAGSHPIQGAAAAAPAGDRALGIHTISVADLKDALARGYDDFHVMPRHLLFICIIYPLISFFLIGFSFNYNLLPLVFPLVAGFALVGPFFAIGLYELSRRRERSMHAMWWHMFSVVRSPSARPIFGLGLMLMIVFLAWLVVAFSIYRATFGTTPLDSPEFWGQLLTTGRGWALIILGNGIGAVFAVGVFATTVVSFPLLVDRKVSIGTAVATSLAACRANAGVMLVWGMIVVGLLVAGSIPAFIGLAAVLPILGHATWHLYKKLVEPSPAIPAQPIG